MVICRIDECKHNDDGYCSNDDTYIEWQGTAAGWYPICEDFEEKENYVIGENHIK